MNGLPVAYHVSKENDRLVFNPAEVAPVPAEIPTLWAHRVTDNWIITGTNERNLAEQAIEDLINNENKFL